MQERGNKCQDDDRVVSTRKFHKSLLSSSYDKNLMTGFTAYLTPRLAKSSPKPPINKSRARIKSVTPMARAAEIPNAPRVKTWLASREPKPPGKGTRNASQLVVHAAMVCQSCKLIPRNEVMSAYSVIIPAPAASDAMAADHSAQGLRLQNLPAICSVAMMKRIHLGFPN